MSRTIQDLLGGTTISVKEDDAWVEYIKLYSDSQGTVILRNDALAAQRMNSTNVGTYNGCLVDTWLENSEDGFLTRFDSTMQTALVARSISTYVTGDTEPSYINRRAFLLSAGELGGSSNACEVESTSLPWLMINKNTSDGNTARKSYYNGSAVNWWLRSPYSASAFYYVVSNGNISNYNAASNNSVRPALNVENSTPVSDEGADIIYVLPDAEYREVDFTVKLKETNIRPGHALATYNATNLTNVAVYLTNNLGDASPVWYEATSQQEIALPNTSKETENWQLGIRCYGRSTGLGSFTEPYVKWRT